MSEDERQDELLRRLERDVAVTPSGVALSRLAFALVRAGRSSEAYAIAARSVARDPSDLSRDLLVPSWSPFPALGRWHGSVGWRGLRKLETVRVIGDIEPPVSPVLDLGRGLAAYSTAKGEVVGVDLLAGATLWRRKRRGQQLAIMRGEPVIVSPREGAAADAVLLDAATGHERSRMTLPGGAVWSAIQVGELIALRTGSTRKLDLVDVRAQAVFELPIREVESIAGGHGGLAVECFSARTVERPWDRSVHALSLSGDELWSLGPAELLGCVGDTVFVRTEGRTVRARQLATGTQRGEWTLPGVPRGIIVTEDRVILGSSAGLLALDRRSLAVHWQLPFEITHESVLRATGDAILVVAGAGGRVASRVVAIDPANGVELSRIAVAGAVVDASPIAGLLVLGGLESGLVCVS